MRLDETEGRQTISDSNVSPSSWSSQSCRVAADVMFLID
jgi:hypothetical protein